MKHVKLTVVIMLVITFAILGFSYAGLFGVFNRNAGKEPAISSANSRWPAKQEFINTCLTAQSTADRAQGDTAKARKMCDCLADHVETRYPEGLQFQEATKATTLKDIDAEFCYKRY